MMKIKIFSVFSIFILAFSFLLNLSLLLNFEKAFAIGNAQNYFQCILWIITTFAFITAAWEIYKKGQYRIFKSLLYLSIPMIFIYNSIIYQFNFGPELSIWIGSTDSKTLSMGTNFHAFVLNYKFSLSTIPKDNMLKLGINLFSIIILVLLKRLRIEEPTIATKNDGKHT